MPFITGIVSILPPIIIGILVEYIVFKFLFIRLLYFLKKKYVRAACASLLVNYKVHKII